ncbi:hypothetical protein Pmani_018452 [Petrolisthes manimaculis]|uniref:Uncharacterized protein n=1 Tax=Petrolisthes manimaculis TaxID=1843537 RepID=A0AAE1U4I4_9EUCA|nr:hypothetical protein Pmani_018452 [Petrolisthes manimaculis]
MATPYLLKLLPSFFRQNPQERNKRARAASRVPSDGSLSHGDLVEGEGLKNVVGGRGGEGEREGRRWRGGERRE